MQILVLPTAMMLAVIGLMATVMVANWVGPKKNANVEDGAMTEVVIKPLVYVFSVKKDIMAKTVIFLALEIALNAPERLAYVRNALLVYLVSTVLISVQIYVDWTVRVINNPEGVQYVFKD